MEWMVHAEFSWPMRNRPSDCIVTKQSADINLGPNNRLAMETRRSRFLAISATIAVTEAVATLFAATLAQLVVVLTFLASSTN